jgi:hypothetical protein
MPASFDARAREVRRPRHADGQATFPGRLGETHRELAAMTSCFEVVDRRRDAAVVDLAAT